MAKNDNVIVQVDKEDVREHATAHHAKCPHCNRGNLFHQVALGITHDMNSKRTALHKCDDCESFVHLAEGESYPQYTIHGAGRYKHISRE